MWLINSFNQLKSLRAERRIFLQILLIISIFILFNKLVSPVFQGKIQEYFSCSIGLSLASFSSLFLRQVVMESRTSIYLVILALFPFTLFYIFYIYHYIFAFELFNGDVYAILDFFFIKAQSALFAITMVYDWILINLKSNHLNPIVLSIDGQLAKRLYLIKILVMCVTIVSGLFYDEQSWHTFSETAYATLVLLILVYFMNGKKMIFRKYFKGWLPQSNFNYYFPNKQREVIHAHFHKLKKETGIRIITQRNSFFIIILVPCIQYINRFLNFSNLYHTFQKWK